MSDIFDPQDRLIPIVILGKTFEVPEKNVLLRQMQYVSSEIGYGRYCWNGECHYCEVSCRLADGRELSGLGCRIRGVPGMRVTECTSETRYNLSEALAAAPPAEERVSASSRPTEPEPDSGAKRGRNRSD